MSQVENTRPRTGQIVRPAAFQPGDPRGDPRARGGQRDPGDGYYPAHPIYPGEPPPYGQGGPGGGGCGSGECGCGSSYCGPGSGFCWYCMKQMLVKEMACLLKTDPTLQAILAAPKQGITTGAWPLAGQVGEVLQGSATVNVPAIGAGVNWQSSCAPLVLSAGNWLLLSYAYWSNLYEGIYFWLNPIPAGVNNDMAGGLFSPSGNIEATTTNGAPAVACVTVPTLLPFGVSINGQTGGSAAGEFILALTALRTS